MDVRNLFEPLAFELLETGTYVSAEHKKTFFEMIFVLEGSGVQIINDFRLPYLRNQLFLVFPYDSHGFEVIEQSRFFFIRFNGKYLSSQGGEWLRKIEFIFHTYNHVPGCILKNIPDKLLIRSLVEALSQEHTQHPHGWEDVGSQLVNTIISVAARNIAIQDRNSTLPHNTQISMSLVSYVHEHIYDPGLLKAGAIASHFNVSSTYISSYFKKFSGQSLQQYIANYKLKLIETRLRYTEKRISEIVTEFGFTDESHLNRFFKKHRELTPSAFRKSAG